MRPIVLEATLDLAASPEQAWPFLSDTDRMNRLLSKPATYRPIEEGARTAARFVADTTIGGFSMTYEESPFEWTVPRRFFVARSMRSGVLRSYTYETLL